MNIYYCSLCNRLRHGDTVTNVQKGDILLPERKACIDHPDIGLSPTYENDLFVRTANTQFLIAELIKELIELKKAR